MADFLFISPSEITTSTILGGNVDKSKYVFCIADAQITIIEVLLGTELYDKILSEAETTTLSGDYLTLYNEYVKPITKYSALSLYIDIADIMVTNGGLNRHTSDNAENLDKDDKMSLSQRYAGLADMYIIRFNKWILNNPLAEYKTSQDEVNANNNVTLIAGWKL